MQKIERKYNKIKTRLVKKIQPLLEPYGIDEETIVDAIEESLSEIHGDESCVSSWLLSMVFWKIFDDKYFLSINPRTPAGNAVPFNVLIAAHVMWHEALHAAAMRGIDDIDAADTLVRVVNVMADRLACGKCAPIRSIHGYMFTGYLNRLNRLAGKIGNVRICDLYPTDLLSDDGAFVVSVENRVLRNEILAKLPPKEQAAAFFHYVWGYSYKETATMLGLSYSAVRMILTRGIRKYAGSVCGNRERRVARKRLTQENSGLK